MKFRILGAVLTLLTSVAPAIALEKLTAVHAYPVTLAHTKSFLQFVELVNEQGRGIVEIEIRGGPEAMSVNQQPEALRAGVIDLLHTVASYYGGSVPEKDAMVASNITAVEARQNGGLDLMNKIHQEKFNAYLLGWFDSGVAFNIWTKTKPSFDSSGNLDFSNIRLRGNSIYNAFFSDYLNAQVIDLPTGDVYSALERNVINATGWTEIGLTELHWDDYLAYRIEPRFFSTDITVLVNLDRWNSLSEDARKILQGASLEHEKSSIANMQTLREEEFSQLKASGMQIVSVNGEARINFLTAARSKTWDRMRSLMRTQLGSDENYDALISLFYDPAKDTP